MKASKTGTLSYTNGSAGLWRGVQNGAKVCLVNSPASQRRHRPVLSERVRGLGMAKEVEQTATTKQEPAQRPSVPLRALSASLCASRYDVSPRVPDTLTVAGESSTSRWRRDRDCWATETMKWR